MRNRDPLVVKLKSGEYDGADIMAAWLALEDRAAALARKDAALKLAVMCLEDADDGVDYKHLLMREAALAACRAELEGK